MTGEQTQQKKGASGGEPPPPYQDYAQPYAGFGAGTEHVILVQTVSPIPGSLYKYRDVPACIVCQFCCATVTTAIDYQSGCLAWLLGTAICLLGGVWGCCIIPCCVNSCLDVVHICPNCGAVVGNYQRGFK